jgi:hypothetical protein
MAGNVVLDSAVGAVPVIGILFDAVFKANVRNMRILRDHLERTDRVIDGQTSVRGGQFSDRGGM